MQIVIELSDKTYKDIKEENSIYGINNGLSARITGKVVGAIQNGTPLPKGHGRLKDEDEVIKAIEDRVEFLRKNDAVFMRLRKDIDILGCIPKIRCEVPPIIEADKEDKK